MQDILGVNNNNNNNNNENNRYSSSSSSSSSSHIPLAHSLKRILREQKEICGEKHPFWCAYPLHENDPYEWHFTIKGPTETDFEGGIYHGRIVLPHNYPLSPPSVTLLTQNGRFEVGKKVCLSASSHHPELWQPAWSLRTMLDALHAFFPTPGDGALHSLDWSPEERRKVAKESVSWSCPVCKISNQKLIMEKCCDTRDKKRPELPEQLENQARGLLKNQQNKNNTLQSSPQEDKEITSPSASNDIKSVTCIPPPPSETSPPPPSFSSSSNSPPPSSKSRERDIPLHRQPPDRARRSLTSQIFCMPKSKLELIVFISDILMVCLLISIFFLLAAIVVQPPYI